MVYMPLRKEWGFTKLSGIVLDTMCFNIINEHSDISFHTHHSLYYSNQDDDSYYFKVRRKYKQNIFKSIELWIDLNSR